MQQLNWYGLYSDSWQGEITPEAFSHPAKYSRALIRKIYSHMLESGYIKPGDKVIDPFGGVALGAYHALQNGLVWYGCELEPKFVSLGNQNIDLWNNRYAAHFAKWGTAVLVQGDSRNLAANIQGYADVSLSSPPYADRKTAKNSKGINIEKQWETYRNSGGGMSLEKFKIQQEKHSHEYGTSNGQLGNMTEGNHDAAISSSPFGAGETRNRSRFQDGFVSDMMSRAYTQDKQGITNGNLAHLETKESDFQAAVSSPAYVDTVKNGEGPGVRHDPKGHKGDNAYKATSQAAYGGSNGQLGGMNGGGFEAAVSSSPFEKSLVQGGGGGAVNLNTQVVANRDRLIAPEQEARQILYADNTDGQLGKEEGQTFWQAARQIVEQTYMVLKPGAYTAWVCGDFVRGGKRVFFGRQWMELCQAVGFEPVEWAIAWKTEYKGNQKDVFGNDNEHMIDRISFFRRLANANAHANEHWQTVDKTTQTRYLNDIENTLTNYYHEIMAGMEPPILPTWNVTLEQMRQFKEATKQYERITKEQKTAKPPTPQKILQYAKMAAWIDADGPRLSDVAILNEDVIFMRKPL